LPVFFPTGEDAFPALIAAHRLFAASAIAFRPAALNLGLRRTGVGVETAWAAALIAAGRPRRFAGPCRACIAAFEATPLRNEQSNYLFDFHDWIVTLAVVTFLNAIPPTA
jgi:hypothetical protein